MVSKKPYPDWLGGRPIKVPPMHNMAKPYSGGKAGNGCLFAIPAALGTLLLVALRKLFS